MKTVMFALPFVVTMCGFSSSVNAGSLANAVRETRSLVNLRLRMEEVDQADMSDEASALTLRGRLGFRTGVAWHTSLLAEGEYVWPLSDDYNSTLNGKTCCPTIADPETSEVNRLLLTNTSLPATTIALGRQAFTYDDARFVAASSWRQNEQTFDGISIRNESIQGVTVNVAYVNQVNRSLGRSSKLGRYTGSNNLTNVGVQTPIGQLSLFDYRTSLDQAPRDSTATSGARLAAERKLGSFTLGYVASRATQRDRAGNPLDFALPYQLFELSGSVRGYAVRAGAERLGGNGIKGVSTPLGSGHAIDGFADKFASTPPDGLDNRYVALKYSRARIGPVRELSAAVKYLSFDAVRTGVHDGDEVDLQLEAKWARFSGMLKYADYRADGDLTDTQKLWMQMEFVL